MGYLGTIMRRDSAQARLARDPIEKVKLGKAIYIISGAKASVLAA